MAHRTTEFWQHTDTPTGTDWSSVQTGQSSQGPFAITLVDAKWFRGREATHRQKSTCPDPSCCRHSPKELEARWSSNAWPSAQLHARIMASLPTGRFPGVDEAERFAYLERHSRS